MSRDDGTDIYFYPDADGSIGSINYNGNRYYYVRNAQNDIIGITDKTGAFVARYTYDEWGNITSITDGAGNDVSGNPNHIANLNPLRYRSYFYDAETGFYWLNTRYYDPAIGRFINADGQINLQEGVTGYNLFQYCGSNPINRFDPYGCSFAGVLPILPFIDGPLPYGDIVVVIFVGIGFMTGELSLPDVSVADRVTTKDEEKEESTSKKEDSPEQPVKYHLHHIVAKADHRAALSRQILMEVGINPMVSSHNLVSLPQSYHASLHTTAYHKYVESRLLMVRGSKAGVVLTLSSIKAELLANSITGIRWT